jgi:hypothetical protein
MAIIVADKDAQDTSKRGDQVLYLYINADGNGADGLYESTI